MPETVFMPKYSIEYWYTQFPYIFRLFLAICYIFIAIIENSWFWGILAISFAIISIFEIKPSQKGNRLTQIRFSEKIKLNFKNGQAREYDYRDTEFIDWDTLRFKDYCIEFKNFRNRNDLSVIVNSLTAQGSITLKKQEELKQRTHFPFFYNAKHRHKRKG